MTGKTVWTFGDVQVNYGGIPAQYREDARTTLDNYFSDPAVQVAYAAGRR